MPCPYRLRSAEKRTDICCIEKTCQFLAAIFCLNLWLFVLLAKTFSQTNVSRVAKTPHFFGSIMADCRKITCQSQQMPTVDLFKMQQALRLASFNYQKAIVSNLHEWL